MQPLLKIEGLTKSFGALVAVNDVSFEVEPGEILGIAGPNGSGKCSHPMTGLSNFGNVVGRVSG